LDRLLITGVNGFIGQALAEEFHEDYEVWGAYESVDSMESAANPQIPADHRVLMNLKNMEMVEAAVKEVQPVNVIHLAARSEVADSFDNYLEVADINFVGTVRLAEALRAHVPNLQLLVFASTMETYGDCDSWQPANEDTPQCPKAPYAVAKVAAEKYLLYMNAAYTFPATILRQTNTYGRHDNDFFIVERILTQMIAGGPVNLGVSHPFRNFLYIDDLVALYRAVLKGDPEEKDLEWKHWDTSGEVFVTGPDNALSIGALVEMCAQVTGYDGPVNWDTIPARPGEVYRLNSYAGKAKAILSWEPKVGLLAGLKLTAEKWGA
jgi:nucleoside-diphosphate-sugar epimerase